MDVIIFLIFAIIAVVGAINVVVQSHPISSAISLVGAGVSMLRPSQIRTRDLAPAGVAVEEAA